MKGLSCLCGIMLAAVLTVGAFTAEAQLGLSFDKPLINEQAPEFKLSTLGESAKSMTASREGKDTILFFWATWCPHCRAQLKELSAQKASIEEKGIKVFLVDIGEEADLVRSYVEKNNIAYEVFLDEDSAVSEQYEVIGVPTFVFINKQGVVKSVVHSLPSDLPAAFE